MHSILFSTSNCRPENLYPFTLTRRVQDIRIGMLTLRARWEKSLDLHSEDEEVSAVSQEAGEPLKSKNGRKPVRICSIAPNLLPSKKLLAEIKKMKPGHVILAPDGKILVQILERIKGEICDAGKKIIVPVDPDNIHQVVFPWDIFRLNRTALEYDFQLLTKNRHSAGIDPSNGVSGRKKLFLEKGAWMRHCIINTDDGPVYIGKDATIMEGTLIRGPVYIGDGAVIKMGTRIYGATSVGPGCIVGGEVKNSVLFANSNKAHDGYLGDSVIGEWCNLGAGTSNSNLKNTVSEIRVVLGNRTLSAGTKCGVFMGDFSRTAIQTALNSGTIIGVSSHVFGAGLAAKQIPSFSWGADGTQIYKLEKALQDAAQWKKLKNATLTEGEKNTLTQIYNQIK
jgi:UDP-N-acetylglucosamine diphosphorylase/glucosamine-1-phosphate N-acetyltransferase